MSSSSRNYLIIGIVAGFLLCALVVIAAGGLFLTFDKQVISIADSIAATTSPPTSIPSKAPSETPEPEATPTPVTPTVQELPPSSQSKPTYTLVFVPLRWRGSDKALQAAVKEHAEAFINLTGIDTYFTVDTKITSEGMKGASLSSDTLLEDVIAFGEEQIPADRYIGITDGDLIDEGDDVTGYAGDIDEPGVVVESDDPLDTVHELAHTYGLCDEYSYEEWQWQDEDTPQGCPNPFPATCPKDDRGEDCENTMTEDGKNSIMGLGGFEGDYGFTRAGYQHLHEVFKELASKNNE